MIKSDYHRLSKWSRLCFRKCVLVCAHCECVRVFQLRFVQINWSLNLYHIYICMIWLIAVGNLNLSVPMLSTLAHMPWWVSECVRLRVCVCARWQCHAFLCLPFSILFCCIYLFFSRNFKSINKPIGKMDRMRHWTLFNEHPTEQTINHQPADRSASQANQMSDNPSKNGTPTKVILITSIIFFYSWPKPC